jgi:hypothetical protein
MTSATTISQVIFVSPFFFSPGGLPSPSSIRIT